MTGAVTNPVLEAKCLTKDFRGFVAVDCASVSIQDQSIHAIIGPNGAGKTTFFNLITKFLKPTSGTLHYQGRDITGEMPWKIAQMGIVRSFQISAVFSHLTVLENIRVSYQRTLGYEYQFWVSKGRLQEFDDCCMEFLRQVGLEDDALKPAKSLPYGRKRAMEIATTLSLNPKIMLLDCYWMSLLRAWGMRASVS